MSDIETSEPAPTRMNLLARLSLWLLLFSGVLFVLLGLSWLFLVPRFTWFSAEDTKMSPREMATYEQRLLADLRNMEQTRTRLVLPVSHKGYMLLKEEKRAAPSMETVRAELTKAAARTSRGETILFQEIHLDLPARRVTVRGDVRSAGLSSMTVLAAFVEEVENLSFVSDLERPTFVREQSPDTGPHSPFAFSFSVSSSRR